MPLCEPRTSADSSSASRFQLPAGVPRLHSFYLYLTTGCNLACRHCWIEPRFINGRPDPQECIDPELLFAAVTEAKTLGLTSAKLTGGEPLFHPRFRDIAKGLSDLGIDMDMETNGVLLSPELAVFLKNESKINSISVSLDDDEPESHDAFRGVQGAFDATLRGLDALKEAGYNNTQVIMSVHRGNIGKIEGVVALAEAHGAGSVKFNPVTDTGRGRQMAARGETLGIPELLALEKTIYGGLKEKTAIKKLTLNIPPAIRPFRILMETGGCTGDCGVTGILGILGTGEIAMCGIGQTIPSLVYGRLGDSITDIWLNHPKLQALRLELEDHQNYPGICGDCVMAGSCRTGCVANNYQEGGGMVWPGKQCQEAAGLGLFPASRRRNWKKERA
jgi:SynChlorMet cassette radical SAM/SPASM protein ScmF